MKYNIIINEIIEVLKSSFKTLFTFNYMVLDNLSTFNYIYNNNVSEIIIYHNISKSVLISFLKDIMTNYKFFTELKHKDDISIKWISNFNSDNTYFINIIFMNENINLREETIENIYYNIASNKIIFFTNDLKELDNFEEYIANIVINEKELLNSIIYYLISEEDNLKKNIIILTELNEFKEYNIDDEKFKITYFNFLKLISKNNLFEKYINLIKEIVVFNKIFYGINDFNYFGYEELDLNTYLKLILINKNNFITNDYKKYLKNISENDDFNDFNMISENKIIIYRKLKKYISLQVISKQINDSSFSNLNIFNKMMSILFFVPKDQTNIETLKLAYIYKNFNLKNIEEIKKNFDLFNKIIKQNDFINTINNDDYIFDMLLNNHIKNYEYKSYLLIPEINKKYQNNEDSIDIEDFQDAFIFMYEFVYLNKFDLNSYEQTKEICDDLIVSVLSAFRANKLITQIDLSEFNNESSNNRLDLEYNFFEITNSKDNEYNENNSKDKENKEDKEDKEDEGNIEEKQINNYKKKYEKNKELYKKIKEVLKIVKNGYFDIEIIKNTDNKIDLILNNYRLQNDNNIENYLIS
jgi:hypothetical protein